MATARAAKTHGCFMALSQLTTSTFEVRARARARDGAGVGVGARARARVRAGVRVRVSPNPDPHPHPNPHPHPDQEVREAHPDGAKAVQLYVWRDRVLLKEVPTLTLISWRS